VTIAAAPAINCPAGGVAVTDAAQNTQYVCDGHTGAQGPQGAQGAPGATGTSVLFAETWINGATFSAPVITCCSTAFVNSANLTTVPGSTFSATTTGGRLMIQATIPMTVAPGARLVCQPNIDDRWAGGPTPASFDYVLQQGTNGVTSVTISRVYPAPAQGTHVFTLNCGQQGGAFSLINNSVISFTVLELH
jgi:hypothetical protein